MDLNDRTTRLIIYTSGFLLFCYTVIRAYLLSFTWDESYSYLEFVRHPFWLPHDSVSCPPNNHLLNTWLMKIFAAIFGNSEFSLRMPNLFAHLLYLFFSIKFIHLFFKNWLTVLAFALLNVNPYLLDFFSTARGYGLSMGFMMASLYFTFSFFMKKNYFFYSLLAVLSAFLAVLSNFILFPFFLIISFGFIVILSVKYFNKKTNSRLTEILILLFICSVSVYFILPYTLKLKACGAFFFGGDNFFTDTLVSLFWSVLYGRESVKWLAGCLAIFVLLIAAVSFIILFKIILKKQFSETNRIFIVISSLSILCFTAPIVQHFLMGTKFPMQRTGLFLLPLFALLFAFLLDRVKNKKWVTLFSVSGIMFSALNFISSVNFHSLLDWKEEADIKPAMESSMKSQIPVFKERFNLALGSELLLDPVINYYRVKDNLSGINPANCREPNELCDYYLAGDFDAHKKKHVKTIVRFSADLSLLKNEMPGKDSVLLNTIKDFDHGTADENKSKGISNNCFFSGNHSAFTDTSWVYSLGADIAFDKSLMEINLTVSTDAMIFAANNNFDGRLVVSFEHKDGSIYSWQAMDIRDMIKEAGKCSKIVYTRIISDEVKIDDHLKVYLWNFGISPICIDDINVRIITRK